MAQSNKSMYAILGILTLSPSTGYEIKKYCDTVLSGFWNENYGHIYPTLKKMVEKGWIEVVSDTDEEKRIRYTITTLGKEELEAWFMEETPLQPVRSEFMLKFMFSSNQPTEHVVTMLEEYAGVHKLRVENYERMLEKLKTGIGGVSENRTLIMNAILHRGVLSDRAVIAWCEETIQALQKNKNG